MKYLISMLFMVCFLLSSPVLARQHKEDGDFWVKMSKADKKLYLEGIQDSNRTITFMFMNQLMSFYRQNVISARKKDSNPDMFLENIKKFIELVESVKGYAPKNYYPDETVEEINKNYLNPKKYFYKEGFDNHFDEINLLWKAKMHAFCSAYSSKEFDVKACEEELREAVITFPKLGGYVEEETVEEMDKMYEDTENRKIPMYYMATKIVIPKLNNSYRKEELLKLRKEAAK